MATFCFMPRESSAGQRVFLPGQLQLLEQRRRPRLHVAHAVEPGGEAQVLQDGEVLEQLRLVGHEGQAALGLDRVGDDVVAADGTVPVVGAWMPTMHRSVDVLPAPLGPIRPTTSPGPTRNEKSSTALNAP